MHSAPAVRYPVVRSSRVGASLLGVWAAAAAVCIWWWLQGGVSAWHLLVVLASLFIGGAVAFLQWHRSPVGDLRWDGQAWWWQFADEDEVSVNVQVRLDFQQGVLLEMTGWRRRAVWCCPERATLPARWADLRRALYSSAITVAPDRGAISPP